MLHPHLPCPTLTFTDHRVKMAFICLFVAGTGCVVMSVRNIINSAADVKAQAAAAAQQAFLEETQRSEV